MPVGDCERTFAAAAARDGIVLERAREPWLNQRGHLGLPDEAAEVRSDLADIFKALGGLPEEQAGKRLTPLPGDFRHPASGTPIEVDESQHFTSFRLVTLELFPADVSGRVRPGRVPGAVSRVGTAVRPVSGGEGRGGIR